MPWVKKDHNDHLVSTPPHNFVKEELCIRQKVEKNSDIGWPENIID